MWLTSCILNLKKITFNSNNAFSDFAELMLAINHTTFLWH